MTSGQRCRLCLAFTCAFTAAAAAVSAQGRRGAPPSQTLDFLNSDAATGAIVTGAPYSGEGVTTVTQTLGDGTRIERRVTAKFYRDRAGRVRREQTIFGLAALNPSSDSQTVVTITDPVAGTVFSLNPSTREARRMAV